MRHPREELRIVSNDERMTAEGGPAISKAALSQYGEDEMICAISDYYAEPAKKTVLGKARRMCGKFGLHALYFARGFLEWTDARGIRCNSPILLCPIDLFHDKKKGYWFQKAQDGRFEANGTLAQMLRSSFEIELPQVEENWIEKYFDLMKKGFEDSAEIAKEWTVDETGAGIGLFHYQRLQLRQDMEDNKAKYIECPTIRRLCGEAPVGENENADSAARANLKYLAMDADSSQLDVIKSSQEGQSFVLQGPPGSGKSQTIANIVCSALGEGRSVLLVAEKASARSVVIDNLRKRHSKLPEFILDFDEFRNGYRTPFVDKLNEGLDPYVPAGAYGEERLRDEERLYGQIRKLMDQAIEESDGRNCVRLLQDVAPFAEYADLKSEVPASYDEFSKLLDAIEDYCDAALCAGGDFDYAKHPLCGCLGDRGDGLFDAAQSFIECHSALVGIISRMLDLGWEETIFSRFERGDFFGEFLNALEPWIELPGTILSNLTPSGGKSSIDGLIKRAKFRMAFREKTLKMSAAINEERAEKLNSERVRRQGEKYRFAFMRAGRHYKAWKGEILKCFVKPLCGGYRRAKESLDALMRYFERKNHEEKERATDMRLFGASPIDREEWEALASRLERARRFFEGESSPGRAICDLPRWLSRFDKKNYGATIQELAEKAQEFSVKAARIESSFSEMREYFEAGAFGTTLGDALAWAGVVSENKDRLSAWAKELDAVSRISADGRLPVLRELIDAGERDFSVAKKRLSATHRRKIVRKFVDDNELDAIRDFARDRHERLLRDYAEADDAVLSSGAKRLYEKLRSNLDEYCRQNGKMRTKNSQGRYIKIQSKPNCSIKKTILDNWEYVRRIKPCFMMSPLNASQYIDAEVKFDLVIFDEASQIFAEDALAAIMRSDQTIICGDSKQLPPCDFFKAGDGAQDDDDQYFLAESNRERSLLSVADATFGDGATKWLRWHYRSRDESLIAFANKEMGYGLIAFPSAVKAPDDGIAFREVEYRADSCYVAGRGASHVNSGEAEEIIKIIYDEMTERAEYSICVVAFSNAQASEIEERWEKHKKTASAKNWQTLKNGKSCMKASLSPFAISIPFKATSAIRR